MVRICTALFTNALPCNQDTLFRVCLTKIEVQICLEEPAEETTKRITRKRSMQCPSVCSTPPPLLLLFPFPFGRWSRWCGELVD